jgi:aminopeptidase N
MTSQQNRQPIYLKDYQPPAFLVDKTHLEVQLDPHRTRIHARLHVRRNPLRGDEDVPLVLDGEALELIEVRVDGDAVCNNQYNLADGKLTVVAPSEAFIVETVSYIDPENNKALSGLFRSRGVFCTQCEPEGFRRITWFIDRPDVMSVYTVRIEADKSLAPVLLANGNLIDSGVLAGGRHFALWQDPFKKPSYLFAMVGGDLAMVEDSFTTMSGRRVTLRIYVEHGKEDRCGWAMDSLKRAMRWDEQRFGREYDLDLFMIVAVSDFNMGAMENKGLNIFNDKLILARADTATDADYAAIESVVAHEYFHNWTGNRITCRDWFQLCLKEGLTVYRDQEFSADERDANTQRISDVRHLQSFQFPEDTGPLAHPVRPDHFIEINNFYTSTVYQKGAELVRMVATLLGRDGFRAGMDLYFQRHDGEAATVEQFLKCFEDASGEDLSQFMLWYEQAGTPELACSLAYDGKTRTARLKVTQLLPPTPGQTQKKPQLVPLKIGLIDADGSELPLRLEGGAAVRDGVLRVGSREQTFRFTGIDRKPAVSLLRGFSAPIRLNTPASEASTQFLIRHDSDLFNRWQATQAYITRLLIGDTRKAPRARSFPAAGKLANLVRETIGDDHLSPAFRAQMMTIPSESDIARQIGENVDPEAIHASRSKLRAKVGAALADELDAIYRRFRPRGSYSPDAASAGKRSFRHAALALMAATRSDEALSLVMQHYRKAGNMTEAATALDLLAQTGAPQRDEAFADFYDKWRDDHLVIDKWFALQAMSPQADTLQRVEQLMSNPLFTLTNPNKVRALIGVFASGNQVQFNRPDGKGYDFLAERIIELDSFNPQIASRLAGAFKSWRILEPGRREKARATLERLAGRSDLSRDTDEILSKVIQ